MVQEDNVMWKALKVIFFIALAIATVISLSLAITNWQMGIVFGTGIALAYFSTQEHYKMMIEKENERLHHEHEERKAQRIFRSGILAKGKQTARCILEKRNVSGVLSEIVSKKWHPLEKIGVYHFLIEIGVIPKEQQIEKGRVNEYFGFVFPQEAKKVEQNEKVYKGGMTESESRELARRNTERLHSPESRARVKEYLEMTDKMTTYDPELTKEKMQLENLYQLWATKYWDHFLDQHLQKFYYHER